MKISNILLYFFFLSFFCATIQAQKNPQSYFQNYGTEQGLPSPEVHCVFEDSKGYMWFGTDNGAARFDGYEFKTYGPKEGLMSTVIFDIYEDNKGCIWFGTMTGQIFILENEVVYPYQYNDKIKNFKGKYNVAGLVHLEKDRTVYVELEHFGFLKIDSLGNIITIQSECFASHLVLELEDSKELIRTISSAKDSAGCSDELIKLDAEGSFFIDVILNKSRFQKKFKRFNKKNPAKFDAKRINASNHFLFFGGNNILCLSDTNLIWSRPFDISANKIFEGENGTIWLCLDDGNGVRRYENIDALKQNKYDQFLNGLSISNILKDSKRGIWFTSLEKGIYYSSNIEMSIYDSWFGLSSDFVQSVTFKNNTELFIGVDNGDIFQVNMSKNKILNHLRSPSGYSNYDLFFDRNNNVLYSNFSKWENERWFFAEYWNSSLKKFIYTNSSMNKIYPITENELIGLRSNGFLILNKNKHKITFHSSDIQKERILGTHFDHSGRLWVGRQDGVFLYKDSTFVSLDIKHPAFDFRVEDIHELPDSTIVFGTKGYGVILWKEEKIEEVNEDDGLTSNMLENVHVDENGILWAGTLNGLNKISRNSFGSLSVRQFTISNGLPSNEIYQIRSYKGQVWLCTAGGLVKFIEPPIDTNAIMPSIQYAKNRNGNLNIHEKVKIDYDDNDLEIKYLAINFRQNGKIPYRYRITSKEDWQYTQNLKINYPSLNSGKYTFEIEAQNQDGYWSESAKLPFEIFPPWWQSWWFRLSFLVGSLILAYAIYQYRTRHLRKENKLLRQVNELERSALQAQMNPHFIFNCLNSIQNYILQNDKKKAVEFLSRFARLVRHNLDASVQGLVSLEEEVSLLDNYLALERERFNNRFDYNIQIAPELKVQTIEFPPMLIQPYVENAIIHGLADKGNNGKVELSFNKSNGALIVNIIDNGKGYCQNQAKIKAGIHKSVGMSITQKRLELLDKKAKDFVDIQTLKNKYGEPNGTQVSLRIKVKKQKK